MGGGLMQHSRLWSTRYLSVNIKIKDISYI